MLKLATACSTVSIILNNCTNCVKVKRFCTFSVAPTLFSVFLPAGATDGVTAISCLLFDRWLSVSDVQYFWLRSFRQCCRFDGADYELALRGAMSSLTFRWWVEVPAEWQGVGAVFDYVMAVADGCRAWASGEESTGR